MYSTGCRTVGKIIVIILNEEHTLIKTTNDSMLSLCDKFLDLFISLKCINRHSSIQPVSEAYELKDTISTYSAFRFTDFFPEIDYLLLYGLFKPSIPWRHMSIKLAQITGNCTVCSTTWTGREHRKRQRAASLILFRGIQRCLLDILHQGLIMRKTTS